MNFTSEGPPGTLLKIKQVVTFKSGPRRMIYRGDRLYIQREKRRYYCRVLEVHDEHYRTSWGRKEVRRVAKVQVLEYA